MCLALFICAVGLEVTKWFVVRPLAFFYHSSSKILLLCLHIVVFLPVGMGVFRRWSYLQTHYGFVWTVGSIVSDVLV